MNKRKVDRIIEKIVRGFYYYLFGERLSGVSFHIEILSRINSGRNLKVVKQTVRDVLKSPTWRRRFGSDAWAACTLDRKDRRAGTWIIGLGGGHMVFAITEPSDRRKTSFDGRHNGLAF